MAGSYGVWRDLEVGGPAVWLGVEIEAHVDASSRRRRRGRMHRGSYATASFRAGSLGVQRSFCRVRRDTAFHLRGLRRRILGRDSLFRMRRAAGARVERFAGDQRRKAAATRAPHDLGARRRRLGLRRSIFSRILERRLAFDSRGGEAPKRTMARVRLRRREARPPRRAHRRPDRDVFGRCWGIRRRQLAK